MTVPTGADSAPPALTRDDYAVLAEARSVDAADPPVEAGLVVDLLAVYDKVAARLGWVAAQHAFCQMGGAE